MRLIILAECFIPTTAPLCLVLRLTPWCYTNLILWFMLCYAVVYIVLWLWGILMLLHTISVLVGYVTDDNSRLHTVNLSVHAGGARTVSRWFHTSTSTWYFLTNSGLITCYLSYQLCALTHICCISCAFICMFRVVLNWEWSKVWNL